MVNWMAIGVYRFLRRRLKPCG